MLKRIWVLAAVLALKATVAMGNVVHFPVPVSDTQTVQVTLKLPLNMAPGQKFPVMLIFGGFESAGKVLELVHTDRQIALASFDYPYEAPREFRFPEGLKSLPELKAVFPKTEKGIAALVDALRKRPEIDTSKIVIIGASFGAPFAVAAAAQDSRIAGVVLVHGFGRIPETLEHVILRSWLPRYGWVAHPLAWSLSRLGWLYLGVDAPENLARKLTSQQSLLMITAEMDSFIPRESSDSLWLAIQESQAQSVRQMMPTDHLMPGSEQLIAQIIKDVEGWMAQRGLN